MEASSERDQNDFISGAFVFYWRCFKQATRKALRLPEQISFYLALFIPFIISILPQGYPTKEIEAIMNPLIWVIPLSVFVIVFLPKILVAPFSLYEELISSQRQELKKLTDDNSWKLNHLQTQYHELREARRDELYKYNPEANFNRIFRIFFDLYKEGEFLKLANTDRRRKWDERVIQALMDHGGNGALNLYLLNTGRKWDDRGPLLDEEYDKAVEEIHSLVFHNDFNNNIHV